MLVLSRKEGEKIRIDFGGVVVWLTVVEIRDRYKVRFGFEADLSVTFTREELLPPHLKHGYKADPVVPIQPPALKSNEEPT